jgi:SAM-dependent methyltransferase
MSQLPHPFADMMVHFLASRETMRSEHKSEHWDVFQKDFESVIAATDAWPVFLRNSISAGFNDDLSRWVPGADGGSGVEGDTPWNRRRNGDFSELLQANLETPEQQKEITNLIVTIMAVCGREFVLSNLAPDIGSPPTLSVGIKENNDAPQQNYRVSFHDLILIYYCWQVFRVAASRELKSVVEIGGGFGGIIAKIKDLYPNASCVLFDLPEVNAVQTYYLQQRFPEARILGFHDFQERGPLVFGENADFLILPGWLIEEMPHESVDLAINIRSMMEMTPETVGYYFDNLHRAVRIGGVFACANRYQKISIIKEYPFDDYWRILLSQTSNLQGHIHELIVERTSRPQPFSVRTAMKSLAPFV